MARYLVNWPHTDADCVAELDSVLGHSHELFARVDWGCKAGEHMGWAILEAGSPDQARSLLPAKMRAKAHVVGVNKFTEEDVKSFHEQR
jgi:hypothetical protein